MFYVFTTDENNITIASMEGIFNQLANQAYG